MNYQTNDISISRLETASNENSYYPSISTHHKVNTKWVNKLAFNSTIDNHTIRLDTNGLLGDDSGPSPKKLLLASLAGCTGMDVASLLTKMRVPFTGLEIDITADLTEAHPKIYSRINLNYIIKGEKLDQHKVAKAVALSQEKYCGVIAMLQKSSSIKYVIKYEAA